MNFDQRLCGGGQAEWERIVKEDGSVRITHHSTLSDTGDLQGVSYALSPSDFSNLGTSKDERRRSVDFFSAPVWCFSSPQPYVIYSSSSDNSGRVRLVPGGHTSQTETRDHQRKS